MDDERQSESQMHPSNRVRSLKINWHQPGRDSHRALNLVVSINSKMRGDATDQDRSPTTRGWVYQKP